MGTVLFFLFITTIIFSIHVIAIFAVVFIISSVGTDFFVFVFVFVLILIRIIFSSISPVYRLMLDLFFRYTQETSRDSKRAISSCRSSDTLVTAGLDTVKSTMVGDMIGFDLVDEMM